MEPTVYVRNDDDDDLVVVVKCVDDSDDDTLAGGCVERIRTGDPIQSDQDSSTSHGLNPNDDHTARHCQTADDWNP